MSVLQLAIETGNKDFLALKVCKAKLRDIWKAKNTNALWQVRVLLLLLIFINIFDLHIKDICITNRHETSQMLKVILKKKNKNAQSRTIKQENRLEGKK